MLKPTMMAFLALTLASGSALAAGSEPAESAAPATTVTIPEVSSEVAAPATTATIPEASTEAVAASDPWSEKWGDLGPKYKAAVALVKKKRFTEAIKALKALKKPKDPRVLNYLGFSHRKIGKIDKALEYYFLALNIAPDFLPAREYLGEAFVQAKDLEKARAELAVIEKLCGNQTCEEYRDLAEDIQKAEAGAS
jgi:tetratricopeptide (TPR) repeat protein